MSFATRNKKTDPFRGKSAQTDRDTQELSSKTVEKQLKDLYEDIRRLEARIKEYDEREEELREELRITDAWVARLDEQINPEETPAEEGDSNSDAPLPNRAAIEAFIWAALEESVIKESHETGLLDLLESQTEEELELDCYGEGKTEEEAIRSFLQEAEEGEWISQREFTLLLEFLDSWEST